MWLLGLCVGGGAHHAGASCGKALLPPLQGSRCFSPPPPPPAGLHLDLVKKVEFALDIARGMSCLHAQQPPVIHRSMRGG